MATSEPATAGIPPRTPPGPLRRILPLIGLALLAWILSRQDGDAMASAVSRISLPALLTAGALFTANLGVKALRWHRLLRAQGHPLPLGTTVPAFFAGQFYGQVTFGRLGEFYRAEALTARGVPAGRALSSCMFDRVLDLMLVVCLGAVLGALVLGDHDITWAAATLAVFMVGGALGAIALKQTPRFIAMWRTVPSTPDSGRLERLRNVIYGMLEASAELLRPAVLVEAAVWTCAAWLGYFAALWTLAAGLGISVGPVLLTTAACMAALSALLPITVSGLGARELIYAEMLATGSVDSEVAVVLSLLHLAVMSASAIGFGLLGVLVQRRSS